MSFPETSEELLNIMFSTKCLVIKFSAEWCRPCKNKQFLDSYHELKAKYKNNSDVVFLEFDVDDNQDLVNDEKLNFNITSIPNLKIYNKGKKVSDYMGTGILKEIGRDIEKIVNQ
jgi:thioredoxin-like negative regulator of GroEL